MMLLRKFVFGDYALVAELLAPEKHALHRGSRFGAALHQRLYAIRMMFFDEDVPWSEWEKILTVPSTNERVSFVDVADGSPFAAMDMAKLVEKGRKLQFRYLREVGVPVDFQFDNSPVQLPRDYFWDLLRERHLMWLGDVPAKWIPTAPRKGRILVDGEVMFENYDLVNAPDDEFDELRLDIYIDLYGNYQVTTIGNERGVFGFAGRHVGDETLPALSKFRLDRRAIVGTTSAIHEIMRGFIDQTNYRNIMKDFWENKGGRDMLNRTYMSFAFNANDDAISMVSKQGIAAILGNDGQLVRKVAAISLAASAGLSPEELQLLSWDFEEKPSETVQRVGKLWAFDNLPLARVDKDGFLDSAF